MKRSTVPWTESEEATIVARFESGMGYAAIGEEVCRSELAVQARLLRLGKITPEQMGLHPVS